MRPRWTRVVAAAVALLLVVVMLLSLVIPYLSAA